MNAQLPHMPQSAQPVAGAVPLDPQFLDAVRTAGANVDQEGARPVMERPLAQAASGLAQLVSTHIDAALPPLAQPVARVGMALLRTLPCSTIAGSWP